MLDGLLAIKIGDSDVLRVILPAVDLLLVWFFIYRALLLIRGTKAIQALVGLVLILIGYVVATTLNLTGIRFLLDNFISNIIIILIVVFHQDLRKALSKMGQNRFFMNVGSLEEVFYLEELVKAATVLSAKRIGALIVIERDADLTDYTEEGTRIDSRVSREMILAVMHTTSPIHDGAIIIQDGVMTYAGCVLPLTVNPKLSRELGTRHRAAIGISEETDALVVVVSEETGKISFVTDGHITRDLDGATLKKILQRAHGMRGPAKTPWSAPQSADAAKRRSGEIRRTGRETALKETAAAGINVRDTVKLAPNEIAGAAAEKPAGEGGTGWK